MQLERLPGGLPGITPDGPGRSVVDGTSRKVLVCEEERTILCEKSRSARTRSSQEASEAVRHLRPQLSALCDAPCVGALYEMMSEADVMGDGSCWVYILLLWHGMAPHAVTPVGRLRSTWRLGAKDDTTSSEALRVRMEDIVADLALREAMARWMTRNAWARRALQSLPGRTRARCWADTVRV